MATDSGEEIEKFRTMERSRPEDWVGCGGCPKEISDDPHPLGVRREPRDQGSMRWVSKSGPNQAADEMGVQIRSRRPGDAYWPCRNENGAGIVLPAPY